MNNISRLTKSGFDVRKNPTSFAKVEGVVLALCLIAIIGSRLMIANAEVDWDEEVYFLIARGWRYGQIPYRDIFDHKPPGVYVIYLFGTGFGSSIWLLRALVCGALVLGVQAFTSSLAPSDGSAWRTLLAVGLFAFLGFLGGLGSNTEVLYVPALLFTLSMLVHKRPVAAGLFASIALAIKYTVALDLLGVLIFYFAVFGSEDDFKIVALKFAVSTIIMTTIIYVIFYLYFIANGVDIIHAVFLRNLQHASNDREPLVAAKGLYKFLWIVVPIISITLVFSWRSAQHYRAWLGALAWLLLSLVQAGLTGKYYYHYFLPSFVPLFAYLSTLRPGWRLNALFFAGIIGASLHILHNAFVLKNADENLTKLIRPYCPSILRGAYIMDLHISGYRECGAKHVDKFVFPSFYFDPHFEQVSGSGGIPALKGKLEAGLVTGVLIFENGAYSEKFRAQDIPDHLTQLP